MSSLFTVAEEELATLGLAATSGERLSVLVGGLGLGYTADRCLTARSYAESHRHSA
jgi:spermidine synthase